MRHSELASAEGPARFVQVWLRPDATGTVPTYARVSSTATPGAGLVPVAGDGTGLTIGVAGASYGVARLAAGESVVLPAAPRLHAYVASGALLRSSLAEPLQVAFSKSSWNAPVSNDPVTIGFKQHISANEPLRTGAYTKTLTFTLSTTTP